MSKIVIKIEAKLRVLTKELSFEILLHSIIVADKDIASDSLVSGQSFRGWQSLEPLIRCIFVSIIVVIDILISFFVNVFILFPRFPMSMVIFKSELPKFLVHIMPFAIHRHIVTPFTVRIKAHRRRRVNPLVKPAVQPDSEHPLRRRPGSRPGNRIDLVGELPAIVTEKIVIRFEIVDLVIGRRGSGGGVVE